MEMHKFTFFWQQSSPFSQWHLAKFTLAGYTYNCCEQYMMHQKALLFGDEDIAKKVMLALEPKNHKRFGRLVKGFDKEVWEANAKRIVYEANHAKFTQNAHLLKQLMKTKGTTLVEASPHDTIWGVGLSANDPRIQDPSKWLGTNWLGEVLTQLRNDLQ